MAARYGFFDIAADAVEHLKTYVGLAYRSSIVTIATDLAMEERMDYSVSLDDMRRAIAIAKAMAHNDASPEHLCRYKRIITTCQNDAVRSPKTVTTSTVM